MLRWQSGYRAGLLSLCPRGSQGSNPCLSENINKIIKTKNKSLGS